MSPVLDHPHDWIPLGNLEVCRSLGCTAHRASTVEAEEVLDRYGDTTRLPMKED